MPDCDSRNLRCFLKRPSNDPFTDWRHRLMHRFGEIPKRFGGFLLSYADMGTVGLRPALTLSLMANS